jgi:hypothetical protein
MVSVQQPTASGSLDHSIKGTGMMTLCGMLGHTPHLGNSPAIKVVHQLLVNFSNGIRTKEWNQVPFKIKNVVIGGLLAS